MMSSDTGNRTPILQVVFYRTEAGREPVRDWLLGLARENRRAIGQDIMTAQYGWPLGMPLIRKLDLDLWEIRAHAADRLARIIFTVQGNTMVLLHGFIKKSRKTPAADLRTARQRLMKLGEE